MMGPFPPSLRICNTISMFALSPAAAAMRSEKSVMRSNLVYFVADSRVRTTWRMLSTKPSKPTKTLVSFSWGTLFFRRSAT